MNGRIYQDLASQTRDLNGAAKTYGGEADAEADPQSSELPPEQSAHEARATSSRSEVPCIASQCGHRCPAMIVTYPTLRPATEGG